LVADGEQIYDTIIVGGGSAGCVLASRLSAQPNRRVLLIEAGEDFAPGQEPPEILDSFAGTAHSSPRFTWKGITAAFLPRPGNAPDGRPRRRYAQGRVIGGGSSINGMASNRGLPSDYADWVAQGATGWGWDDVLPYFRKLETDHDFDGPLHGANGPIGLKRFPSDVWPGFSRGVLEAIAAEGYENIGDQNGVFSDGYFPVAYANIDDRRVSAAMAYLTAEVRARPNLEIISETIAERLLTEGRRITGVRVRCRGEVRDIKGGEVIVSLGALNSPALLLRSGIGPGAELSALGIEVLADRAGVGKHLMEHPGVNMGAFMKPEARLPMHLRRQMFAGHRFSSGLEDCPAGDMYIIPTNKAAWHAIGSQLGLIMLWVNKSYSTGEVRLTAATPGAPLDVDFDMCSDTRDLQRLVAGVRRVLALQAHPAVQATVEEVFPVSYSDRARRYAVRSRASVVQTWLGAQMMDSAAILRRAILKHLIADGPTLAELAADDTAIEAWIRETVLGHWHACSTCRMGVADDPGAVTDPSARVYGVEGLRVCDASIMPMVPCANTNIPTIMVAEKVADAILNE
jgi:5-(hydroxymethyl)furfural/furfural oxidase